MGYRPALPQNGLRHSSESIYLGKFCSVLPLLGAGKCNLSISDASTISAGSKDREAHSGAESSKRLSPFGQRHSSRSDTFAVLARNAQGWLSGWLACFENMRPLIRRSRRKPSRASPSARQAADPHSISAAGLWRTSGPAGGLTQERDAEDVQEVTPTAGTRFATHRGMHILCKSCFRKRDANCWNNSRRCCHVR
jgi:hypothetical protein